MDSSKGTEWEQVDGKVFYELVMSEPEKHFFIRLVDDTDFSNGTIILEVTRDEYIAWKKSYNEKQYFQRKQAGMVTVSLDAILENMPGMDVFVSHAGSIEEMMLEKEQREQLKNAISTLSKDEKSLLRLLYSDESSKTEEEIANILGITQQAVSYRKKNFYVN